MAFVVAKCTECGASIEVDDCKTKGTCRHCGTTFLTDQAINNYTTNIYIGNSMDFSKGSSKEKHEKQAPTEENETQRKEKIALAKKLRIKAIIYAVLLPIFLIGGMLILSFTESFIRWAISMPLGIALLIPCVIFCVMFIKTERKITQLRHETQQINSQNSNVEIKIQNGNVDFQDAFKGFFND